MKALGCSFCQKVDSLAWATGVGVAGSISILCLQCLNDSTGTAICDEERTARKCDSLTAKGCAGSNGGRPVWYCYTCKSLMCDECNNLLHNRREEDSHDVRHASLAQFDDASIDAALEARLRNWADTAISINKAFTHWTIAWSEGKPKFVCLCCTGLDCTTKSFACGGKATQMNLEGECSTSFLNHLRGTARHKDALSTNCVCSSPASLDKSSSGQSYAYVAIHCKFLFSGDISL
jgi:hypothetical protein